ncbi:ABC transporter ATP-binding protein [Bradyrhizobium erythrophlei]|uniref:ABC transporter ATP-binding protein n=1 Tax=Bradyrhizobium erythrophlei TaxID=1437360 RepID=UPI0035E83BDB
MNRTLEGSIMSDAGQRRRLTSRLYARIFQQIQPYWPHLLALFLLGTLGSAINLLVPLPLKIAVDSAISNHPLPPFLTALLPDFAFRSPTAILMLSVTLLIAISLLLQLQDLVASLLASYAGEKIVLDFRARLVAHAQRLSFSYHDAKGSADSIYRIQTDAMALQYLTVDGFIPMVSASLTLLGMIWVTARIDWQLSLVALAVSPVLFALSKIYRPLLRDQSYHIKKVETSTLSVLQEILSSLRVVQAFGREKLEQERYIDRSAEGMRARLRLAVAQGGYGLLVGLTTALGTATVVWIGVSHVQANTLTLGSLLLVMAYLGQLYEPLKIIGRKVGSLQAHLASAERAFFLLDEPPKVFERSNARPLARALGAIEFRNVSFQYQDERPVLQNLCLEISPGARVGIAGHTGAGKSTLVSLLPRFHDVTTGQILLDGRDVREYKLDDLRNQFSIVLQEPVLFSTSIAENIRYARPRASEEEIIKGAKLANVHDFIASLPDGYQTLVGERGMRLSGGERQRISLARAFIKDAPILILDEPTSAVDVGTEAAIIEAMERLMCGRTTFMIAHRLSTLENCDLRLQLENGHLLMWSRS